MRSAGADAAIPRPWLRGVFGWSARSGHVGWGLANFFLGFTTPIYLFVHVEQSVPVRLGLLALMLSPLVVIGMAVAQLASALA